MAKYIPDILSRRWVIVSNQRLGRPEDVFDGKRKKCPFCVENESELNGEIYKEPNKADNGKSWLVKVVQNKYPITDFHEVIIHSPAHDRDFAHLPPENLRAIFRVYRMRYNVNVKNGQVIIFCNHGLHAGASLEHPHSQLVVIPFQINLDSLSREKVNNVVKGTKFFDVYCPDFSQWPYEVWIAPKAQSGSFGDITDYQIDDLADIFQFIFKRYVHIYQTHKITQAPYGYNYYIYPKDNWFIRIIPRFVNRAGFELGTGLSVNVVDPLDASLELRGMDSKVQDILERLKAR